MDEPTRHLLAAASGQRDAIEQFVAATQSEVWRFCAHLVDAGAADDLTQDVYVRAFRSLHRFRGDGSARAWLLTIARRVAANEIQRRQRQRSTLDRLTSDVQRHTSDESTEHAALLAELSHNQRFAFVLTQLLGYSYRETAAICEVPVGTIRSRVARARSTLIDHVRALDHEAATQHSPQRPARSQALGLMALARPDVAAQR